MNFMETYQAEHVMRITADCLFMDRAELFYMFSIAQRFKLDVATNADSNMPRVIDGFDCEWASYRTLLWLDKNAKKDEEREHVFSHLYNGSGWADYFSEEPQFKYDLTFAMKAYDIHGLHPEIKLSIDTQEEFDKFNKMVAGKNDRLGDKK